MTPEDWLGKLPKLKVDKARKDPAPHKPLLLLVVLDLAEQGQLRRDALPLTPELVYRFSIYSKIVAHRRTRRPDIRYPFYHLKTDGFWSPLDDEGKPTSERFRAKYAAMPSDFVAFASDPVYRDRARRLLIAKYFEPFERLKLYELVGIPVPSDDQIARDAVYQAPDVLNKVREARFRLSVMAAYDYTCALTGYRLTTITGRSLVDAAHIHQFAESGNNDPKNGLALTKNAHWLFDCGLWTLSADYRVLVAQETFAEAGPDQHLLAKTHGEKLRLPADQALWPSPVHIAWHRTHRYRGA